MTEKCFCLLLVLLYYWAQRFIQRGGWDFPPSVRVQAPSNLITCLKSNMYNLYNMIQVPNPTRFIKFPPEILGGMPPGIQVGCWKCLLCTTKTSSPLQQNFLYETLDTDVYHTSTHCKLASYGWRTEDNTPWPPSVGGMGYANTYSPQSISEKRKLLLSTA